MTEGSVLVLNRAYQPVHVTSVKRAFVLLYTGLARALDHQFNTFDFPSWAALSADAHQDTIHTVDRVIRVPRVILLLAYDRIPRGRVRFSRHNIFARDDNTCQYCGRRASRSELNIDHVVPRSRGGLSTWENVVCSCVPCNVRKGGRTPAEAGVRLIRQPQRPRWTPLWRDGGGGVRYKEWLPYLTHADVAYWNTELID